MNHISNVKVHLKTRGGNVNIEKCQRKAAFICTGAFRLTSNERLLNELGWEKWKTAEKSIG